MDGLTKSEQLVNVEASRTSFANRLDKGLAAVRIVRPALVDGLHTLHEPIVQKIEDLCLAQRIEHGVFRDLQGRVSE